MMLSITRPLFFLSLLVATSEAHPKGGGGVTVVTSCPVGKCLCRDCYEGCEGTGNANTCLSTSACLDGICMPFIVSQDGAAALRGPERRSLQQSSIIAGGKLLKEDDAEYDNCIVKCGGYDYEVFLLVTDHFYAIASPKEEAVAVGCPFVVVNAVFGGNENLQGPAEKQLLIWESKEEGEAAFGEGSHRIGTFKASDLAQAYEQADPSANAGGLYDILTNNCAHFMINLGKVLGVNPDAQVASYVTRRLLSEAGKGLVKNIRQSANYFSIFEGRHLRSEESVSDGDVIQTVVNQFVSKLFV